MADAIYGRFDDPTIDAYRRHLLEKDEPGKDKQNKLYQADVVRYYVPNDIGVRLLPGQTKEACTVQYYHDGGNPGLPPGGVDGIEERKICTTLSASHVASMLYMDVGRWGGVGEIDRNTDRHWRRQRNFGIVCGDTAVLCDYQKPGTNVKDPKEPSDLSATIGKSKVYEENIKPLLKALSTNQILGPVTVLKALSCPWPNAEKPTEKEIHVFLGDLHAPIMTNKERTYLRSETPPLQPPVLNGRIDMNAVRAAFIKHGLLALLLPPNIPLPSVLAAKIVALLPSLAMDLYDDQKITQWPTGVSATKKEVEEWYYAYHGGTDKGADIFEEAGNDLFLWIDLLLSYQKNLGKKQPPLRFVQTGDLFDFWIGLKNAVKFGERFNQFYNHSAAHSFMDFWLKETRREAPTPLIGNTEINTQARAVNHLLNMDNYLPADRKINPTFLYGNHDNYLGAFGTSIAHISGVPGLHAEHGHASDTWNSDDNPSKGWAFTQLAFVYPMVREIEDEIKAAVAKVSGEPVERLLTIQLGLNRCVFDRALAKGQKPKLTFVMGHTHEPILKEVRVLRAGDS